ncbi:MAG: putative peptide-modifying radical SAM/SPASM domain-containing protein [Thermoplasmata archaeon HGW-Thermoplasmata-1]|nr:MAG: putative peptide-modifying radical SAM/SPASM domain-containing protein [Thermoplasmata archaeon HGW-Thermoplasmata-1]
MLYIVSTTGLCNLCCRYCGGSISEEVMPHEVQYDIEKLARLVGDDPDATVAFYGGEPLLRIPLISEMMEKLPAKRFVVQTNGTPLDELPQELLCRFDAILVSLDGRRHVTDTNRGEGVYDRVVANVEKIRPIFGGDLIARMAVSEECGIYEDVMHLFSLDFDHVHWQLNAIWASDDSWTDFGKWIYESYNPGITRLKELWLGEMKKGKILGIVPFQGIVRRMFFGGEGVPCGAGSTSFAVATDGRILACPICGEYEWNRIGELGKETVQSLRGRVGINEPCRSCDVYAICGGRCLFANREGHWKQEQFDLVCMTVRHLAREMRDAKKRIDELLKAGTITREQLDYPQFNNTTEIIP